MEQHILAWIAQYGYLAIFAGLMFGIAGLPVPDETLLTFTGYLIYKGHLRFPLALAAALGGSMCGITLSYWLGRTFGMAVIHRYGRYLHIREEHILKTHAWFERIGHWALTVGYFIPGVRHFTAFAAGMSELEVHQFAVFAYSGAVIWVATFLGLGYLLGERWHDVEGYVHRYVLWGGIAAAVLTGAFLLWQYWRRRKRTTR